MRRMLTGERRADVIELWTASVHVPGRAVVLGRQAEQAGFDGVSFGDTQHRAADPYAGLCMVARETDRLRLMVGVTNPVTRHPAVTAASIATVQLESAGRAVLGIGRGDSALAHLGRPPAPMSVMTEYVQELQGYLGAETVGAGGQLSRIDWIARSGMAKVPLDVAATGPRMIALGARCAERLTINVGAEPERVAWALELARKVRAESSPDSPLSLGAYLVIGVHTDIRPARDLARGCLGAYAHFSGMPGSPVELLSAEDRAVIEAVAADYDLANHGQRKAGHTRHLDDAFVDRYGVVGSAEQCVTRLRELIDLGLDHVVMVEGRDPSAPADEARAHELLASHVLPAVHEHSERRPG